MRVLRVPVRGTRAVAAVAALLVPVLGFTLVLNSGSSTPGEVSSSPDSQSPGGSVSGPQEGALVTRMLGDLRAGRRTESQDQPLAGAPVRLIRAGADNPAPIGELRIPAIGLRTRMFEGVYTDALAEGPGHWPGTPAPGEPGNSVISGHRSTETRPFLYLDRLAPGDRITIIRGDERFTYAVDLVTIVPERRYVPFVLKQPANARTRSVTLFACNPVTAHYQRIVVRAHATETGRST